MGPGPSSPPPPPPGPSQAEINAMNTAAALAQRQRDAKLASQRQKDADDQRKRDADVERQRYDDANRAQNAANTAYYNRSQSAVSPVPAATLANTSFSPATISQDQIIQAKSELIKYQNQLATDTANNNASAIENDKNRIQQYQSIIAGN